MRRPRTVFQWVLVILASALFVGIGGYLFGFALRYDDAPQVKVGADLVAIKTNLMQYQAANGFYPSTEQGLKALVVKPETDPEPVNWHALDDRVPRDPWNFEYQYRYPGKHNPETYDIFSAGPDRNPETENDNIGNWEAPLP